MLRRRQIGVRCGDRPAVAQIAGASSIASSCVSTRPAPTQPLALGTGMAANVEPHHRAQPTSRCLIPPRRHTGPSTPSVEELDRPATPARRRTTSHNHPETKITASPVPRIEANR
jgi:hypothetical protein